MKKKIIAFFILMTFFHISYGDEIREIKMIDEVFKEETQGKHGSVEVEKQEHGNEHIEEEKRENLDSLLKEIENKNTETKENVAEEKVKIEVEKVENTVEEKKEEIISVEEEKSAQEKDIVQEQKKEQVQKKEQEISNVKKEEIEQEYLAALVADKKGNIYYSKNIDTKLPMASVTKVMTLLVTFDAIRSGQAHYNDKVVITKDVYSKGGSGIKMRPGETFTLIDLIRATAIYSANNAAYAIAKYIGKGSVSNFVKKMNKKAREIGVSKQISYYTPAGLPTRYTKKGMDVGTARGIYKLSRYALSYPEYLKIAGIKEMRIHNQKIKIRNRNHLLGKEGIYGIKTGYHKEAKYNITVVSDEGKKELIVVVLGGNTYKKRDEAVLYLLEKVRKNL